MRIGVDLRSLQEKQKAGISRYVLQLCKAITSQDRDNEYYFYFNTFRKIKYPEFTKQGIIVHTRIPSRIFNFCARFLKLIAWDKKNNLDVFWQPSFNFIHLSKDVKKVLTVHDLSWLINRKWYSYKMYFWHILAGIPKQVKQADKVIAVSKSTASDINFFYSKPADKIKIIYSGINREVFNNNDCSILNLPEKYLLFIGTVEPRKNILGIIQAMELVLSKEKYKDIHLVIMGASGWSNKEVYKAIRNSKHRDKFHYVGYTTNRERDCYIKNSLALIWPSFYEGFGHPPLEALYNGKPVIASYSSSLPEVIKDNGILVDPYNITEIKEAILNILDNDMNIDVNLEAYDWNKAASYYIKVFNSFKK
ncbi:glycosyltransferase family 4 protein [Patescibacteria group bacterium]|nr:glycosyltransferase family 4 protein [Patescibacteria group bacterium]